jgi:hypothetical protein
MPQSEIPWHNVSLSMVGFVNDSTRQVNNLKNPIQPTPVTLTEYMHHDAKLWNDLLWILGGLLELDKCSYHHIHFDFDSDGNVKPWLGPVGHLTTIPDNQRCAKIDIHAKSLTNPHKTLGHTQPQLSKTTSSIAVEIQSTGQTNCNQTF